MITMLYEKTLSRKVVSISTKARPGDNDVAVANGNVKEAGPSRLRKVIDGLTTPFRLCGGRSKRAKSSSENELATMGKILNLMR
jgi:hypothetical protein